MKPETSKLLQRTTFTLALILAGTDLRAQSATTDLTEARQETQIWTTYALSPYLRASDIHIAVENGEATLTGIVEEDVNKDLAKQIALGVDGIESVQNDIVVAADFTPAARDANERTYGEIIDDVGISTAVKSKLLWSKHTDGLQTEVHTMAGVVTLTGTADTSVSKELAGTMAANTHGVVQVNNQLVVTNAVSTLGDALADKGDEASQQASDSWITTKVKSTFIYSSNVDGGDISVTTTNGVVNLSGTLGSGAERALAIELAENVRGVREVESADLVF